MRIGRAHYGVSLAATLATGVLVAGCGGSGDNSTTAALSQAEFVAKGNAMCKAADQRIEAGAHKQLGGGGPPTQQEFEQFATATVIPQTQALVEKFNRLTPPADSAHAYDAMVAELRAVNDRLRANPGLLASADDPFAKANQVAKQAGLDACAGD